MSERIDPDYDPSDVDVRDAIRLLAAAGRMPFHYKAGSNGNGFQKWALGVMALLAVSGVTGVVIGYVSVAQRLTALETKVDVLLKRP